jgi:hypothetical protein
VDERLHIGQGRDPVSRAVRRTRHSR